MGEQTDVGKVIVNRDGIVTIRESPEQISDDGRHGTMYVITVYEKEFVAEAEKHRELFKGEPVRFECVFRVKDGKVVED